MDTAERTVRHAWNGRVFGVGLSRTGTTSLANALDVIGIPCLHYPDPGLMLDGRYADALAGYRAACDITVSAFFEELDRAYPGSRFVLTVRPLGAWLASIERHTARIVRDTPEELDADHPKGLVRRMCFGTTGWDRELFVRAHAAHRERVEACFADRPGDLLVIDVTSGDPWDVLCGFLGAEQPGVAFPHRNRTLTHEGVKHA
ncbi:MAG: sulfotransferase family protein [Planctomycetota bacterium]